MNKKTVTSFVPEKYRKAIKRLFIPNYKKSYSQLGEDIVLLSIFRMLGISKPTFLDIGANDPQSLNNTYLLYTKDSRGVCVEPDPILAKKLKKVRPKDTIINAGVGTSALKQMSADFYLLDSHRLNTFSKEEAERMKEMGHTIKEVISIPLISINKIMKEHFKPWPNFISLDTEGLDYEILKTVDFLNFKPEVFCIETINYEKNGVGKKITEIRNLMESHGYFVFTDTYLNTIFVLKNAWIKRGYELF